MDELEALSNKGIGFIRVNDSAKQPQRTLIVIGVARGGTSLIAGALSHMGVFMGKAGEPVFEDVHLAHAFEARRYRQARQIISDYNGSHDIWGFKRPASIRYIKRLVKSVRHPVFLIIFKDLFAIANRNKISMKLGIIPGLNKAMKDYNAIVGLVNKRYGDMYLFSYEKVMNNKMLLIEELAKIAGKECSDDLAQKVMAFIEPDSPHYLKNTRLNKVTGRLDRRWKQTVSGWAAITNRREPAVVELHINGRYIDIATADLFRQDTKDAGQHPTGRCGFSFNLPPALTLKPSDDIRIVVINGEMKETLPNPHAG